MGRFYKTARPDFSQDFIYQPPWELIKNATAAKQAQYDGALAQTSAMNDLLKINHIDDEVENENVAQEKALWENQIEEMTNELRSTGDHRRLMPRIREIQKGIMQSREDGNIAKFEQSAAVRDKHLAALAAAKKDGGDIVGTMAAYRKYMEDWTGQDDRSLENTLGYEDLIAKPEALDYDAMVKTLNELDPEMARHVRKTPDGKGYLINVEGKNKGVTRQRIIDTVMGKLGQDPNLRSYYQQRNKFGLSPDVFNEDGSFNIQEEDENGNKKFAQNELGSFIGGFMPKAYNEKEDIVEYSNDAKYQAEKNRAHKEKMEGIRQKNRIQLKGMDKEDAEAEINAMNGFNSFAEIQNAPIKDLFSIGKNGVFDEAAKSKLSNIFTDLTKNIKGNEKLAYESLEQRILDGDVKTPQQANAYIFNTMYPSVNDWVSEQLGYSDTIINAVNEAHANGKDPRDMDDRARDIISHTAVYNNHLSKGEDFYAFGIANTTDNKQIAGFETFSKKSQRYLDDHYNSASVIKEFEQLPTANAKAITDIINQNKSNYTFVDVETNKPVLEEEVPVMKSNKGISSSSGRATSHTMYEAEDGKTYIAIPRESNGASELAIRNIAIQGMEETSKTKNELQDRRRGALMQQFQEAKKSNTFSQEIVIEDKFFGTGAKVKKQGNGIDATYTVTDPQFGVMEVGTEQMMFDVLEEMSKRKK